jgi:hypothetical protein
MVSEPPPRSTRSPTIRFLIRSSTIYIRAPSPIVLGSRECAMSLTSSSRCVNKYIRCQNSLTTNVTSFNMNLDAVNHNFQVSVQLHLDLNCQTSWLMTSKFVFNEVTLTNFDIALSIYLLLNMINHLFKLH